jgi:mRNA-degrading endonuclease toxin of MazEF toxin-antitoxin module
MELKIKNLSKLIDEVKNDINWSIISDFLEWFYKKINIHFNKKTPNLIPVIWSIYEVELWTNIWSELNKKRPCVIISKWNYNRWNTVTIVPLRSIKENTRLWTLSFEIDIENTGLEKKSYITVVNIKEISKKRIFNKIWKISKIDHIKLKKALTTFFDIKNL